jgi:hypothetical protein
LPEKEPTRLGEKLVAGAHLGSPKLKIVGCVSPRDNEDVLLGYRINVLHHDGEAVLKQQLSVTGQAKRATRLCMLIGRPDCPEIGVIAVPLHCIAAIAERLKVRDLVRAAVVARDNVVHFECALVRRDAT